MKKTLFTILRILITAGILFFIFGKLEVAQSINIIGHSNILYLIISVLFMLGLSFVIAVRWHQILKAYGFNVSLFKVFRVYMIAFFFNNFLPSTVGMDVVRGAYIVKRKGDLADVISTILLERWIGMLGIILYVSVIPLLFLSSIDLIYFIYVSAGGVLISVLFILAVWNDMIYDFLSRWISRIKWLNMGNRINTLYISLRTIRKHMHLFIVNLILSVLIQVFFVFANYFIVIGQDLNITFIQLLVYVPLISIISMIPITINGIGLRDWAYITFFGLGMKEQAFSLSLTFFILLTVMSLLGGLIFIFEKKKIKE